MDKVKELEDRLLRLRADFENYKKRASREYVNLKDNSKAEMMLKLLPLYDEFGLAIDHMENSEEKEFKKGIKMIYGKMQDLIKKEGVEEMKISGESFDPYKHDAVRQVKGEDGKIVDIIQKGYMFKGKVLRHAKVVVGKGDTDE